MGASRLTSRRSWLFVMLGGIVAAGVTYVFDPSDSSVLASVAIRCVISLMFAVGYAISNERAKRTLIDLLSPLP